MHARVNRDELEPALAAHAPVGEDGPLVLELLHTELDAELAARAAWSAQIDEAEEFVRRARWIIVSETAAVSGGGGNARRASRPAAPAAVPSYRPLLPSPLDERRAALRATPRERPPPLLAPAHRAIVASGRECAVDALTDAALRLESRKADIDLALSFARGYSDPDAGAEVPVPRRWAPAPLPATPRRWARPEAAVDRGNGRSMRELREAFCAEVQQQHQPPSQRWPQRAASSSGRQRRPSAESPTLAELRARMGALDAARRDLSSC